MNENNLKIINENYDIINDRCSIINNKFNTRINIKDFTIKYDIEHRGYCDIISFKIETYIINRAYIKGIMNVIQTTFRNLDFSCIRLIILDLERDLELHYTYADIRDMDLEEITLDELLGLNIKIAI